MSLSPTSSSFVPPENSRRPWGEEISGDNETNRILGAEAVYLMVNIHGGLGKEGSQATLTYSVMVNKQVYFSRWLSNVWSASMGFPTSCVRGMGSDKPSEVFSGMALVGGESSISILIVQGRAPLGLVSFYPLSG